MTSLISLMTSDLQPTVSLNYSRDGTQTGLLGKVGGVSYEKDVYRRQY